MGLIYCSHFIIFLLLTFSSNEAKDICSEKLTVTSDEAEVLPPVSITDDKMSVTVKVNETVPYGSVLYHISWQEELRSTPYIKKDEDNGALDYVNYDDDEAGKEMVIVVIYSMERLIDYNTPNRTTNLQMNIYFEFPPAESSPCQLAINHLLIDENTQTPYFEKSFYQIDIREDFPAEMIISGLEVNAFDFDATTPNNEFDISMNEECPFEPTESIYECKKGVVVPIYFVLREPLDYDAVNSSTEYLCNVIIEDHGNPSRTSSTSITVTVTSYPDEVPEFSSDYYKGDLLDSFEGAVVKMSPPVEASDQDEPPTAVDYAMEAADKDIGGDQYFAIDPDTGIITVTEDMATEFLSYGRVDFILTGCDENRQCSKAFLFINLPVLSYGSSYLQFEKLTYTIQTINPRQDEEILRTHVQTSGNVEDVRYYFADDESLGLDYFHMNESSGVITTIMEETPPDFYILTAMVTDGNQTDQTKVNIEISSYTASMNESIIVTSIEENVSDFLLLTLDGEGANFFCILNVQPDYFSSHFLLNSTSGELFVTKPLNVDSRDVQDKVTIKVAAYERENECIPSVISVHLMKNEALIEVKIIDINEYPPTFVDNGGRIMSQVLYAYPLQKSLQKTIGAVATVMTEDKDRTSDTSYTLNDTSHTFVIDAHSGDIFLLEDFKLEDKCKCVVHATDADYESRLDVEVQVLNLDNIFTMTFEDTNVNEIEKKLSEISLKSNTNIYLLYANILQDEKYRSSTESDHWTIAAQVYATSDLRLLTLDEFMQSLEAVNIEAELYPFSDKEFYETVDIDADGFRAATIVLGCILGLILLLICIYFAVCHYKKQKRKNSSPQMRTLGNVYGNPNFADDQNKVLGALK